MANTLFNTSGIILDSSSGSMVGSFTGFTVTSDVTITTLIDHDGNELASTTPWSIPAGKTIQLYITNITISSGTIILYPVSTIIPQI